MRIRFASIVLAVLVVIPYTATSVTVTASEQPLLRESDLKYDEDAIQVDVPVSASGPDDTSQSRELTIASSSYEKEKSQDRIAISSGGTAEGIKVKAVAETEMKDEKLTKLKKHDRALNDDCTDDESFRYKYINKKEKSKLKGGCNDFVARKKKKRCRKRTIDGRKVRDVCRMTCGSCKKKKKKVCSVERFIGVWRYTSPCKGAGVFELTVRCDDDKTKNHNMMCYVQDKKIIDATEDGDLVDIKEDETCVTVGVVRAKDVVYDSVNGNCLLPFVALDGGTCEEIFREGLGVKAEIAAVAVSDKKDAVMKIKFSRDEGVSYYNDETPYEGYFVPYDGDRRSLLSTSLDIGNIKPRALSGKDSVEFKGGGSRIDMGGIYKERCESWNRQTDPKKFPTVLLPDKKNNMLNEGDECTDRLVIAGDNPDASFQRCFKVKNADQYCWSNSAEFDQIKYCGYTLSMHVMCHPDGNEWLANQATNLFGEPGGIKCGEQCDGFADNSNPNIVEC